MLAFHFYSVTGVLQREMESIGALSAIVLPNLRFLELQSEPVSSETRLVKQRTGKQCCFRLERHGRP